MDKRDLERLIVEIVQQQMLIMENKLKKYIDRQISANMQGNNKNMTALTKSIKTEVKMEIANYINKEIVKNIEELHESVDEVRKELYYSTQGDTLAMEYQQRVAAECKKAPSSGGNAFQNERFVFGDD
jgi:predicted RNA-binding protein with EMAP domain